MLENLYFILFFFVRKIPPTNVVLMCELSLVHFYYSFNGYTYSRSVFDLHDMMLFVGTRVRLDCDIVRSLWVIAVSFLIGYVNLG
ncbi:hypothetical protein QVD17_04030 [Tagetes erecta]|uniref:Uncharacterized protein n=1 Tax=Tagetes erecta TaxID=13708 RepID=A0AAD8L9E5_TARER|nr:hypothetical protein QVD17_04030 [Tagetes erecta]